jgi:DNA recombination protein Rad52
MTLSAEQIKELQAPLDPKHVKKPTGSFGPKGDYLEGWHVINELNRVFGFDGWSYTIDLTRDALVEGTDSKGNLQWQAAYTCVCTLTVAGVTRQDVGFGSGFAKMIGDAVEGATKEAATDALKRCARTFGNIFGLALYDKTRANVQAPETTPDLTDSEKILLKGVDEAPTVKAISDFWRANAELVKAAPHREYLTAYKERRKAGLTAVDQLN